MASTAFPVSAHELFNRKLMDFLDDLAPLLGHLPEFKMVVKSAKLLATLDVRQNHGIFQRYIAPFQARIMAKDERFFMHECDDAYTSAATYAEASAGLVPMLKQVWQDLAAPDREAVWAHLRVLLVLSQRASGAGGGSGV